MRALCGDILCASLSASYWQCSPLSTSAPLLGAEPRVYAVYVDNKDMVWAAEWSGNTMLRFDPGREKF